MGNNTACYKWDGTQSQDLPCELSSSTCCGEDWDCLSNGLCQKFGTTAYAQGTCTDPDYRNCLSFCNKVQFHSLTLVSRCEPDGNSWCCTGTGIEGGIQDCCATNLTTSLEPYPFSTISNGFDTTLSVLTSTISSSLSSATFSSSSIRSSSSLISASPSPSNLSTLTKPGNSVIAPVGSTSPQPANQNRNSTTATKVAVPLAVIIVLLAIVAFYALWKNKFQKQDLVQNKHAADSLAHRPEMHGGEEDRVGELDITHFELTQPDAPRHEMQSSLRYELNNNPLQRT